MGKGWRDDFDAMCRKTIYRRLIGKWGVMSIDYQSREQASELAEQMTVEHNLEVDVIQGETVDLTTGEVLEGNSNA